MRLNPALPLGKGELPAANEILAWNQSAAPGVEPKVTYGTGSHTNELVSLYVQGAAAELFSLYEGAWYPGTTIVDNTHIFEAMKDFALDWQNEGWLPGMPRNSFVSGKSVGGAR